MRIHSVKDRPCPNRDCTLHGRLGQRNIVVHSFYRTTQGRRRRYRCTRCGKTFSSTTGTPYYRLHKPRALFDEVARMSVEGVGKSAIARITRIAWNTAARWLALAAAFAHRFTDRMLRRVELCELQADEIRSFLLHKRMEIWIHTAIEVWSRLWLSVVVGRRTARNIRRTLQESLNRGRFTHRFLLTTDGLDLYAGVVSKVFSFLCVYAQVIKDFRNNRVYRVDRRLVRGTQPQLQEALFESEDSSTVNTAFVERLNLTIRQGCSYLSRRSAGHARFAEHLEGHMALLQCYYNFIRPHRSSKFGDERRTPPWQAGLVSRQLSFREIFLHSLAMLLLLFVYVHVRVRGLRRTVRNRRAATVT
jgi:IS1 family transposase